MELHGQIGRVRLTIFLLLFLVSATEGIADWKMNPYTGKLDYYETTSSSVTSHVTSTWLDTHGGTAQGALITANTASAISSGNYAVQLKSGVTDSSTAVGFSFDTTNELSTAGAKLLSIKSAGVERAWIGINKGSFGDNPLTEDGFAFGADNTVSATYGAGFGNLNTVTGSGALASGASNNVSGANSAAFGDGNTITSAVSFAVGYQNSASGDGANAMGYQNIVGGTLYNTAIGSFNQSYGYGSVALGTSSQAGYDGTGVFDTSVAIGSAAKAYAKNSVALGSTVTAAKQKSLSIGDTVRNAIANSVAFGIGNTYPALFVLGTESHFNSTRTAVGDTATLSGTEIVVNGTFTGNANNWTLGTGWAYNSNNVRHTSTASSGTLTQAISGMTIGNVYRLSYAMTGTSAGDDTTSIGMTVAITGAARSMHFQSGNGTRVEMFVATAATGTITFTPSDTFVATIDTVSVKQVTGGSLSVGGTLYVPGTAEIATLTTTTAVVSSLTTTSLTVQSGGSSGKATCWKTATTLGYCSSVVDASGNCTCN